MRAGCESVAMAERHKGKAAGLRRQLDKSVFSDDADAITALQARIDEREAEAQRIKTYNASARKAATRGEEHGDFTLLDEKQRDGLLSLARVGPYQIKPGCGFPSYVLSNLRANINRDKRRIAEINRREA